MQELITYPGTPLPPLVFKNALLGREEKKKKHLAETLREFGVFEHKSLVLAQPSVSYK